MWLTARELANELHIPTGSVTTLRNNRRVAYINLGSAKYPRYRYQMPASTPAAALPPPIERVGILTYEEVGSILGIDKPSVRKMTERKQISYVTTAGNRRMITVQELRRVLAFRDKRRGQTKTSYSPILVKWLKAYMESTEIPVHILDALINKAAAMSSDRRSGFITRLWNLFDQVNAVLKEIEEEKKAPLGEAQRTPLV